MLEVLKADLATTITPVLGSSDSTWSQRIRVTSQARRQPVHNEILLHVRWSQFPGALQTVCKPSQKAAQLFGGVSCIHLLNTQTEFKLNRPGLKRCSKAGRIWTLLFYLCLVPNQAFFYTFSPRAVHKSKLKLTLPCSGAKGLASAVEETLVPPAHWRAEQQHDRTTIRRSHNNSQLH